MANGTIAASQLEMLSQSGTGIATIVPPATNTNRTLTLPDSTGTLSTMGVGTAVASTSGTSIDFTGIPSWAKKITVMFSGVSTSGTSNVQVQLGDAGGVESTGYSGAFTYLINSGSVQGAGLSSGFTVGGNITGGAVLQGVIVLSNIDSNIWVGAASTSLPTTPAAMFCSGSKTLSDTLTQVRVTTVNGTDTFDAGTINIMYEG